jgi:hypothetical protein
MMPVLFALFGESLCVSGVGNGFEHPGLCAVAGDALTLEIGDVLRERW